MYENNAYESNKNIFATAFEVYNTHVWMAGE